MPKVERGDICIVSDTKTNKEIKGTNETVRGYHTFMITQPDELNDNTPTAHLTWGGLEFLPYNGHFISSDKVTIYRCTIGGRGEKAANYATTWTTKSTLKKTHYSHERAQAVMHDLPTLGNIGYGFDALRRSIKWARKEDKEFSTNKGLTCAAYTVACYQAAAFASLGFNKLEQAWLKLEALRLNKKDYRSQLTGGAKNTSYREYANPGVKTGQEPEAIAEILACLGISSLQTFLSQAIYTDARFIHTDGLARRLHGDNHGWIKVHEQLPKPVVQVPVQPTPRTEVQASSSTINPLYRAGEVNPLYRTANRGTNPLYNPNPAAANPGRGPINPNDDLFADVKVDSW